MTGRIRNWDHALITWARSQQGRSFRWGRTDCATLVRRAHQVMFSRDVFGAIPRWKTLREAKRVLAATGGVAATLEQLGALRYTRAFAQVGDIAVAAGEDGLPSSAVILGTSALVSTQRGGVRIVPLAELDPGAVDLWRLLHG